MEEEIKNIATGYANVMSNSLALLVLDLFDKKPINFARTNNTNSEFERPYQIPEYLSDAFTVDYEISLVEKNQIIANFSVVFSKEQNAIGIYYQSDFDACSVKEFIDEILLPTIEMFS